MVEREANVTHVILAQQQQQCAYETPHGANLPAVGGFGRRHGEMGAEQFVSPVYQMDIHGGYYLLKQRLGIVPEIVVEDTMPRQPR